MSNTEQQPEPLPCPMCGEPAAKILELVDGKVWSIQCSAKRLHHSVVAMSWIGEKDLVERWNRRAAPAHPAGDAEIRAERDRLRSERNTWRNEIEAVICLRTGFTGEPPYVGAAGLGMALTEALDERDRLKAELLVLGDAIRDAALEEAAKACEACDRGISTIANNAIRDCAAAIRALRGRTV